MAAHDLDRLGLGMGQRFDRAGGPRLLSMAPRRSGISSRDRRTISNVSGSLSLSMHFQNTTSARTLRRTAIRHRIQAGERAAAIAADLGLTLSARDGSRYFALGDTNVGSRP
jgi:hypothetical protein